MGQFGANAHGEVLEAGRVPDCYLGLLLDPAQDAQALGVLVVAPAALLHPVVPQPDGTVLYELLTGHPTGRPAMTYVRPQLGDRLDRRIASAHRRWRSSASGRRRDDHFL